jgi:hypothetical protein
VNNRVILRHIGAALAFGCGYLLAGTVWIALTTWGPHDGQSTTSVFQFTESMIAVAFFDILSALSFAAGMVLRSVRLTASGWPDAGRAALMGSGCFVIFWLLILSQPSRIAALAFIAAVPGCLGYGLGLRSAK